MYEQLENFSYNLDEIQLLTTKLLERIENRAVFFYGTMGAGKTTIIKSFLKNLNVTDSGSSPTFGLVNEYAAPSGEIIAYHFDFYRLEAESEALDMGWEEYLYQDKWVFVEWPEKIPNLLPVPRTEIYLEVIDKETRNLKLLTIHS
jgi:tRNA threonylcarbamoyladenosine biosynthesis protein TsaE